MCACCRSCFCAPFRWIARCCCRKSDNQSVKVTQVAVTAIQATGHHRERTWKLSQGRMTYDVAHSVVQTKT